MFTGIIGAQGEVVAIEGKERGDRRMALSAPLADWACGLGDSIAVNGVCLTIAAWHPQGFWADVSAETLACTTFGSLDLGADVHLEAALRLADRLGGHLMSGHVDGVGTIVSRDEDARSLKVVCQAPKALARFIAPKGSIAVDGVSLTVNAVDESRFTVNLVPHTAAKTHLGALTTGARVNLEIDLLARYCERLLQDGRGHG